MLDYFEAVKKHVRSCKGNVLKAWHVSSSKYGRDDLLYKSVANGVRGSSFLAHPFQKSVPKTKYSATVPRYKTLITHCLYTQSCMFAYF